MSKLLFNNCCYCMELRLACFIIGYFQLVTGLLGSVLFVWEVGDGLINYTRSGSQFQIIADITLGVVIFYLLLFASFLLFNVILLVGLHQNKPGLVDAYLAYKYVFLVISFLLLLADALFFEYIPDIVIRAIIILFGAYFRLIIRSYYYKMQESSRETNTPQS